MKFKKKKSTKQRASTYHGWGKGAAHHKGSGNRGGYGRAGSGKKAQGKKPSFWKEEKGKRGFTSFGRRLVQAINIEEVEKNLHSWVSEGVATKNGSGFNVDLTKTPFTKLLATGTPNVALHIKVDFASKNASAKLNETGGSIEVLKTIVKKEKKKPAQKKKAAEPESDAE